MPSEQSVLDLIQECNKDRSKTLAEFIATLFKDKYIEIYLGDSYEEVSTEQISTSYPAVFCGKVIGAYRECLVISSVFVSNTSKKPQLGNLLFLSERAIRGLNEIDGNGTMEDMFLRSSDSGTIKDLFVNTHTPQK
jgi:hypothetical protein